MLARAELPGSTGSPLGSPAGIGPRGRRGDTMGRPAAVQRVHLEHTWPWTPPLPTILQISQISTSAGTAPDAKLPQVHKTWGLPRRKPPTS